MAKDILKLSPNESRVLDYMINHGSITQKDSTDELGNTRLAATIFNLRSKGYPINTLREESVNRYGESTWYGRYVLGNK